MTQIPIKICGLTRAQDVTAAVQAGANALGFVLYAPSPRHVTAEHATELAKLLPAFVTPVLLFVNVVKNNAIQLRSSSVHKDANKPQLHAHDYE
jgi:phosphoribosylanthranilate isomerase